MPPEPSIPPRLRVLLLATLVLGLVGLEAELLLLGHFEGATQYIPLVLIGAALAALCWHAGSRSALSVRMIQGLMAVFVVSGAVGIWLHYDGNAVFELELEPGMALWPLFKAAMAGATPVLAPGAMTQLGLVGLAWAYRHPALSRADARADARAAGDSHMQETSNLQG